MPANADRLGAAVRQRRSELELSQLDVWQNGGPSNTTLTDIENGRTKNLTRTVAKKLDRGLTWPEGTARRIWDGEQELGPTLREQVVQADLSDEAKAQILAVLDAEVAVEPQTSSGERGAS